MHIIIVLYPGKEESYYILSELVQLHCIAVTMWVEHEPFLSTAHKE